MFFFHNFFGYGKWGFLVLLWGSEENYKKKKIHCFYDEYWQMGSLKKGF
jgi:hypothetical protein